MFRLVNVNLPFRIFLEELERVDLLSNSRTRAKTRGKCQGSCLSGICLAQCNATKIRVRCVIQVQVVGKLNLHQLPCCSHNTQKLKAALKLSPKSLVIDSRCVPYFRQSWRPVTTFHGELAHCAFIQTFIQHERPSGFLSCLSFFSLIISRAV